MKNWLTIVSVFALLILISIIIVGFTGHTTVAPTKVATSTDDASKISYVDGKSYGAIGVFHDSMLFNGAKSYRSERFNLSFEYPKNFSVFEGDRDTSNPSPLLGHISIGPEPETSQALDRDFGSEFPPGMAFTFYENTNNLSLERWIKETNLGYTNYNPSDATTHLATTSVAGVSAFTYSSVFGLYASNYVVFLYQNMAVVFTVNDMGPETVTDMQTVLASLKLDKTDK